MVMPVADPVAMVPPVMAMMVAAPVMVTRSGGFDRCHHRGEGQGDCSDKRE
jgi:hypothetical protein